MSVSARKPSSASRPADAAHAGNCLGVRAQPRTSKPVRASPRRRRPPSSPRPSTPTRKRRERRGDGCSAIRRGAAPARRRGCRGRGGSRRTGHSSSSAGTMPRSERREMGTSGRSSRPTSASTPRPRLTTSARLAKGEEARRRLPGQHVAHVWDCRVRCHAEIEIGQLGRQRTPPRYRIVELAVEDESVAHCQRARRARVTTAVDGELVAERTQALRRYRWRPSR